MTTRRQVMKALEKIGGSIDWTHSHITKDEKDIIVDAPDGYVWNSTGCSTICAYWYCGDTSQFWNEILLDIIEGIQRG